MANIVTQNVLLVLSAFIVAASALPSFFQDRFSLSPLDSAPSTDKAKCDCTGTNNTGNSVYVCGDPRLGPKKLPRKYPLLGVVDDYDRFAGLQPGEFLKRWTNEDGSYIYPPAEGYLVNTDGKAIKGNATLAPGTRLDRFGSEYGAYLAEAEAPFDERALPPASLATDPNAPDYPNRYHVYEIISPLTVEVGPIAPWFGQPGLGAQMYTGYVGNILKLKSLGYIKELDLDELDPPGKKKGSCG